jgi:surface polysaccharide O-acyltransferase-like enzyme
MQRNYAIDQARFLAAAGVVWIHSLRSESLQPLKEVGRFAVPFFVILTILLTMQGVDRAPRRSLKEFITQKFQRLYLPMILWSVAYLLLKCMKIILQPNAPNDFPGISFLWGGTAYHLWFIPFMFAVCIATFMFRKMTLQTSGSIRGISWLLVITAFVIAFALPEFPLVHLDPGLEWMWRATPSALLGIALFNCSGTHASAFQLSPKMCVLACITGGLALLLSILEPDQLALQTIAGLMFFAMILNAPSQLESCNWLTQLGRLSMGIYFSHLLLVKVGEIVFNRFFLLHPEATDLLLFTGSLLGSIAIAYLLFRSEKTKWLVA